MNLCLEENKILFPFYFNSDEFKTFLKNIRDIKINNIDNKLNSLSHKMQSPKVTFLGTSSMNPGKNRNISAILIDINRKYSRYSTKIHSFYSIVVRALFNKFTKNSEKKLPPKFF